MKFKDCAMRMADFLYRKLGLNIFKAAPHLRTLTPDAPAPEVIDPEPLEPPTPINPSTSDVIHIAPGVVATRLIPKAARFTSRPAEAFQTWKVAPQNESKYRSTCFGIKQNPYGFNLNDKVESVGRSR